MVIEASDFYTTSIILNHHSYLAGLARSKSVLPLVPTALRSGHSLTKNVNPTHAVTTTTTTTIMWLLLLVAAHLSLCQFALSLPILFSASAVSRSIEKVYARQARQGANKANSLC
jgi:hypothetical protein